MDANEVFYDVGLSDVQSKPQRQPDLWKLFVCLLLDARVYCNGVARTVLKAVEA